MVKWCDLLIKNLHTIAMVNTTNRIKKFFLKKLFCPPVLKDVVQKLDSSLQVMIHTVVVEDQIFMPA